MNKLEKIQTIRPYEIAEEIIKISAASTWKCRLCIYDRRCNKGADCKTGIERFFTLDEVTGKEA